MSARTVRRPHARLTPDRLRSTHGWALLLFALVILAYLWPALLGGHVLSPVATLYEFAPWRPFAPPDLSSYDNPLLIDVPGAVLPWQDLARELVHGGVFPAWNPYALAGTPFFANPQVAWLSPFTALSWVFPLHYALGLAAALKLLVAAVGTYLLARELRLGFWPGVLAGLSFAFCAFNVVWLTHSAQVSVAVTLPWLIWLVERVLAGGSARAGLGLAAVSALAFSGGHPGTELHVMTATVVYALVRSLTALPGRPAGTRLRRLGTVFAGLAVGALLLAVVLLPGARAAEDTIGTVARAHGGSELAASNLPLGALRTIAFPDWWGRPDEQQFGGPSNYNERTLYAGAVALLLAALAVASPGAWRRKLPFVVLAALALAVTFRVPGIFWLATHLPVFESVSYQRILLLFSFAVAILAGFGLQALLAAGSPRRRAWLVVIEGAVLGLAAIASLRPTTGQLADGLRLVVSEGGQASETVLGVASAVWWLVFVTGLALALLTWRRRSLAGGMVAGAIVVLAALDMLHFAGGYQPMGPRERAIPPRTPAVTYLERRDDDGRVVGVANALLNDWTTVYRLRDVRGHDVPQPSLRYLRLWRLASPGHRAGPPLAVETLTPTGLNALSVLGARFVVLDPRRNDSRGVRRLAGLAPAYRGRDAIVLENRRALPRVVVAADVRVVANESAALARIAAADFDPRRTAVVERGEPGAAALTQAGPTFGSARIVDEGNAEVTIRARLDRRGLVVLGDALAPGWRVEVDGRRASAVRVDSVLRGVVVPAGTHTVRWSYSVPGLRAGAVLSVVGLLALALWALLLIRRTVIRSR